MKYTIVVDSVETLVDIGERLRGAFVFRGHASLSWEFKTTIERAAEKWCIERKFLYEREQKIIQEFQRRAHHYINTPPKFSECLEWMALLQHYGAPTRMLDVTESMLIATFFAIEDSKDDSVVWAFNKGCFGSENNFPKSFKEIEEGKGILLADPFRQNKRLSIQKGRFLIPKTISKSFSEQLSEQLGEQLYETKETTFNFYKEIKTREELNQTALATVWKIILKKNSHSEIMRFLSNSNISAATLFGGLEGFARSLNVILRVFN